MKILTADRFVSIDDVTHGHVKLKRKKRKNVTVGCLCKTILSVSVDLSFLLRGHLDECSDYSFCRYLVKETVPQDL